MVYAPLETKYITDKYFWKDVPCDVKAPFVCKHNSDLLGFHKLSNLVLEKSLDIRIPSMSLTTCLTVCKAQADPSHIAFILEDRCICAKDTAKYKKPIFKFKNIQSGNFLTAEAQKLVQKSDSGASDQQWIWSNSELKSIDTGDVVKISQFSQDVSLAASDGDTTFSGVRFVKGNLIFDDLKKILGVNDIKVEAYPLMKEPTQLWTVEQVDSDSVENDFERITLDNKLPIGAWPFDCEKIIPCTSMPQQTCGCDYYAIDESLEKMGIVYNIGSDSEMADNLDFRSCEELKIHGVSISGYFLIGGVKTYCNNWNSDCGRGFVRFDDVCLNISYSSVPKSDVQAKCTEIGASPLITKSSSLYFQMKNYLINIGKGFIRSTEFDENLPQWHRKKL